MGLAKDFLSFADLLIKSMEAHKDPLLKLSEIEENTLNEVCETINHELVRNPGLLIYFDNEREREVAKIVYKYYDQLFESTEISENIFDLKYDNLLLDLICGYAERAKMLRPVFISVSPKGGLFDFYSEAMKCWVHGLDNAAIVLVCSSIEAILQQKLREIDVSLTGEIRKKNGKPFHYSYGLGPLIRNAFNYELLSSTEEQDLLRIKKIRDNAVHKLWVTNPKESYDWIVKIREIMERLLSQEKSNDW